MNTRFLLSVIALVMSLSVYAQNIGIGKASPAFRLDVAGLNKEDYK